MAESPLTEPGDEAERAMHLATALLPGLGVDPSDVRIVRVENLLAGADASTARWRVTLKPRELLPSGGEGKIGKGGELVVDVDAATGEARPVRGGD